MIIGYFGVPGCGKSTLLSKFAVKESKRIKKGKVNISMFILIFMLLVVR